MQRIKIKSEDKRLVFAEVYSPLHIDTDGEAMTADEIEKMAYKFLSGGNVRKIDVGHNREESGCYIVESFIARKNDPDNFIEGAWVLGVKVDDEDLWQDVKRGELNGFSFDGSVTPVKARASVSVIQRMVGKTEKSFKGILPEHSHDLEVEFNDDGVIIPTYTSETLNHVHKVMKATSTEMEIDHSHRLILMQ